MTDTEDSFDVEGFFRTGDLGHRTDAGAVVVTGRLKYLINRGGETISAKEVEDIIATYPGVNAVAVVAMPHARLGETVCAYVLTDPDTCVTEHGILETLNTARVPAADAAARLR